MLDSRPSLAQTAPPASALPRVRRSVRADGLPRAERPPRTPDALDPAPRRPGRGDDAPATAWRGGIVVEVRDTAVGRRTLRAAAALAVTERTVLHLVATHVLVDSSDHRLERLEAPRDMAHAVTPGGDADALLAQAREELADLRVLVRGHVVKGNRAKALKRVAKKVGAALVVLDDESVRGSHRGMPCATLDANRPLPRLA